MRTHDLISMATKRSKSLVPSESATRAGEMTVCESCLRNLHKDRAAQNPESNQLN